MASSDQSGAGAPFSADGASARREPASKRFQSILFPGSQAGADADGLREPDFFADLNLDRVLASMTAGREQYDLKPFFYAPLHEVTAVRYRHEVLRDLEKPAVQASVDGFAERMRRMRNHLVQVGELHYQLQKQAWFLDAVQIYCDAVGMLAQELAAHEVTSAGLDGLRGYLADYTASERFTSLASQTRALKQALAGIRYTLRIHGAKVTVARYDGEADYSAEVQATFAKFEQGAAKSYLVRLPDYADMNQVEAQIAERVAWLYPDVFARLADFCSAHSNYLDQAVGRFDREVQFYLAYLRLVGRLRGAGLPVCYPQVSADSKEVAARETFDIALASKLTGEGGRVVGNDFHLQGPERVFVVTGPNNGGKTTFARTFGQLHYLASLGLPVPGSQARLFLPDRIYTHFEREEDIQTLRGKFEDELVRVHQILRRATSDSVIVMNESFNSTTLNDALLVGTEVMRRILERGCLGVYVTFVDELASLSEATVSMVSQILPDNPAERTFKLIRKPADGLAYAWAIAHKYGLTYQRLMERIGS
ncbi:MAG TPA: DNA mismatch repair protein MutS [Actinomycetes bacterium]|nr:DNA mismatch repair protein MutS [Actinomycetes bacterium]